MGYKYYFALYFVKYPSKQLYLITFPYMTTLYNYVQYLASSSAAVILQPHAHN